VRRDSTDLPPGPFDAVLVDVPCSNTGVLGKRPEARWRLTAGDIVELAELQRRLVTAAAQRLRPGGRLVHPTCHIEPEENQELVQSLLKDHSDWKLIEERVHLPSQPSDGAYQALIQVQ